MEGRAWRPGGFGVHGSMLFRRFRSGGRRRGAGAFRRFRSGGRRRGSGGFGAPGAPGGVSEVSERRAGARPRSREKRQGAPPPGAEKPEKRPRGRRARRNHQTPGGGRNGETGESAWSHARRNRRISRRAPEWRNRRNGNVVSDSNVSSEPPAIASLLARMVSKTLDAARRRWPQ